MPGILRFFRRTLPNTLFYLTLRTRMLCPSHSLPKVGHNNTASIRGRCPPNPHPHRRRPRMRKGAWREAQRLDWEDRTCSRCRRGRSASTSIAATARLLVQLQRRAGDEGLEPLPRRDQVEAAGCRWCPRLAREMTIEPGAWGTKCRAALESRGRPPHNALDDAEQVERAQDVRAGMHSWKD